MTTTLSLPWSAQGETMISADLLHRLRNDLPMPVTIAALGHQGPPSKMSEGYFRFLCPKCGEMRATVNPKNNLAHCFCCQKNLNNIDLLISQGYDFLSAVALLERMLNDYQAQQAKTT
jgi:DNA primase